MTLKELVRLIINIGIIAFGLFLYREGNNIIGTIIVLAGLFAANVGLSRGDLP